MNKQIGVENWKANQPACQIFEIQVVKFEILGLKFKE